MKEEFVTSAAKCPKCKNKEAMVLIEVWTGHEITWEVKGGKFDRRDGNLEPGDPKHVEARCEKCQHQWRIRGASQISDVIKEYK